MGENDWIDHYRRGRRLAGVLSAGVFRSMVARPASNRDGEQLPDQSGLGSRDHADHVQGGQFPEARRRRGLLRPQNEFHALFNRGLVESAPLAITQTIHSAAANEPVM